MLNRKNCIAALGTIDDGSTKAASQLLLDRDAGLHPPISLKVVANHSRSTTDNHGRNLSMHTAINISTSLRRGLEWYTSWLMNTLWLIIWQQGLPKSWWQSSSQLISSTSKGSNEKTTN
jgi:hypothetical protein